jgi:hypothetical protein
MIASLGGLSSWGNTTDRRARMTPAWRGFNQKFLDEANGDPLRAESLRKAHFKRMAIKSARARRRRGGMDKHETTRPGDAR